MPVMPAAKIVWNGGSLKRAIEVRQPRTTSTHEAPHLDGGRIATERRQRSPA